MTERFETFTVLINRISRSMRKIKNREMAEYGLRSCHISCIYYLHLFGELCATELCEKCEEDKATISRAIDYLEKNEFLTCKSKSPKRYKSPLTLTEKGAVVGEKIAKKIDLVLEAVSCGLSDEKREEFYRSLTIISENLDKISNEALKGSKTNE